MAERQGHCTSESFREIIGTFSQVITIQTELGSKRGRPGSRGERARLPSVIFSDKMLSLPAYPQAFDCPSPLPDCSSLSPRGRPRLYFHSIRFQRLDKDRVMWDHFRSWIRINLSTKYNKLCVGIRLRGTAAGTRIFHGHRDNIRSLTTLTHTKKSQCHEIKTVMQCRYDITNVIEVSLIKKWF